MITVACDASSRMVTHYAHFNIGAISLLRIHLYYIYRVE